MEKTLANDLLNLDIHTEGSSILVDLVGQVTTTEANLLQSQLDELVNRGEDVIFLNCKDLKFISSAGLRVILNFAKQVSATQKKLGVYSLNTTVSKVFEISGFDKIINIYKNVEDARASLQS